VHRKTFFFIFKIHNHYQITSPQNQTYIDTNFLSRTLQAVYKVFLLITTSIKDALKTPYSPYFLQNMRQVIVQEHPTAVACVCVQQLCELTHWGWGHLYWLNARSRGLNNLNQLLYCVSLKIYNKFVNYFCELKFSGNTHQRP